jgi:hypothetical protein
MTKCRKRWDANPRRSAQCITRLIALIRMTTEQFPPPFYNVRNKRLDYTPRTSLDFPRLHAEMLAEIAGGKNPSPGVNPGTRFFVVNYSAIVVNKQLTLAL